MGEEVTLSVLVTCFNCVDYIDAAIESVVAQDMPFEWELLIGDDGSTDGTLEAARDWSRRYPENIVLLEGDSGATVNDNKGFRAGLNRARLLDRARGKYLAFLDGDDLLLDMGKYRGQVGVLERPAFKKCSCAAHAMVERFYDTGEVRYQKCCFMSPRVIDSVDYWKSLYFHTNTVVFRRECAREMIDERYRKFLNDNLITYLIIQHGPIAFSNNVAVQYNRTGTGIWTGQTRAYGALRNLALYDLEIEINPSMRRPAFLRHRDDFRELLRWHNVEDDSATASLMSQHDRERFRTMWLMYNSARNKRGASVTKGLIGVEIQEARIESKVVKAIDWMQSHYGRGLSIEKAPRWS